jgi:DNA polymerase delta subunit 1
MPSFGSQPTQSSFVEVLQRLKEEAGEGIGMHVSFLSKIYPPKQLIVQRLRGVLIVGHDLHYRNSTRKKTLSVRILSTRLTSNRQLPFFLVFQQIDVEESTDAGTGAIGLRIYGVTEVGSSCCYQQYTLFMSKFQTGYSVLLNVTDFLPYFYIAVPRGFGRGDLESFRSDLNVS